MSGHVRIAVAAAAASVLALAPGPVLGYAAVSSFELTCSSINVSGSTNAPYVGVLVQDVVRGGYPLLQAHPGAGPFDVSETFPSVPPGTLLHVEVWGTPVDAPYGSDGESRFSATQACSALPVPANSPALLAAVALLLGIAGAIRTRRRRG